MKEYLSLEIKNSYEVFMKEYFELGFISLTGEKCEENCHNYYYLTYRPVFMLDCLTTKL